MNETIDDILTRLSADGNMRTIPAQAPDSNLVDLSSNDYLGLADDDSLRQAFLATEAAATLHLSASASRLLAREQKAFSSLESCIAEAYGASALLFNSGYHANTGIVSALGSVKDTYIIADKLVHASIIDGIKLSGAPFARFRHNDYKHLDSLARKAVRDFKNIIIIAESVYSMDGDSADIDALVSVKRNIPDSVLYIDEAHAVGVEGPAGLGLVTGSGHGNDVDITVGTFGKALASAGAFAVVGERMKQFLINRARSFIFSTALPPFMIAWSEFVFRHALTMDSRRSQLKSLGIKLAEILRKHGGTAGNGHIQPLVAGNPLKAIEWSASLRNDGFAVLPIRTPTVPPGTDRLRFSLSANILPEELTKLDNALSHLQIS